MGSYLKNAKKVAKTKKEENFLQNAIIDIEDDHPRRPRCAYAGEMLQMDASLHMWFGSHKSQLHVAIDYATGSIMGAYFDSEETLNGYYNVLYQILATNESSMETSPPYGKHSIIRITRKTHVTTINVGVL